MCSVVAGGTAILAELVVLRESVFGKRPTKNVLDDRATGGVSELREIWRGCATLAGRDGNQAAVEAKAEAQPVGGAEDARAGASGPHPGYR